MYVCIYIYEMYCSSSIVDIYICIFLRTIQLVYIGLYLKRPIPQPLLSEVLKKYGKFRRWDYIPCSWNCFNR